MNILKRIVKWLFPIELKTTPKDHLFNVMCAVTRNAGVEPTHGDVTSTRIEPDGFSVWVSDTTPPSHDSGRRRYFKVEEVER